MIIIGGAAGYKEGKTIKELIKALDKGTESILVMQNKPNSLGLVNAGVKTLDASGLDLNGKNVFIYGEDPITEDPAVKDKLKQAGFVVVWDMFLTDTAKLADIILPLNSFAESEGTYTNSEGRTQELHKALSPKTGRSNLEAIDSFVNYSFDSGFLAI